MVCLFSPTTKFTEITEPKVPTERMVYIAIGRYKMHTAYCILHTAYCNLNS